MGSEDQVFDVQAKLDLGDSDTQVIKDAIHEAVLHEREECAKLVESGLKGSKLCQSVLNMAAEAIRARG